MKQTISIIIPVLNEVAFIERQLRHLASHSSSGNVVEVIVVDGGSTDGSQAAAASFPEVILLHSDKGRAKQMNAGAAEATGSILYFLHADSFPPKDFDRQIIAAVEQGYIGCFQLKFSNPHHFLLRIASWFTQFSSFLFRGGDQSLFISRKAFEWLQGFDERYVVYEDVELISRIQTKYPFKIINDYVLTSERKFSKNGVWRLYFHFLVIHLKYFFGGSPESLQQYYSQHIR